MAQKPPSFFKPSQKKLLVFILILLAASTRYFKLTTLFHWTLDEEFWSYLPHNLATGYHFPLIGGHIGGTGVYSGPTFVWLMGVIFFVIRSNPVLIAFFVSTVGIITTFLITKLASKYLSKSTALLAAFLYASSTLATIYDRKYWNASLAPILSLTSIYLVQKLIKKPTHKMAFLLATVSTLSIHAHMTGLVVVAFSFLSFFIYSISKKHFKTFLITFLILQTPLLIFDIRHQFTNSKALINLATSSSNQVQEYTQPPLPHLFNLTTKTFSRLLYTPSSDIANELTLCTQYANKRSISPLPFQIITLILLVYSLYLLKHKNPFSLLLFLNLLLVITYKLFSPQNFYPGQLAEYYFLPSFPIFFILAATLVTALYKKAPLFISTLILFIIIINLHTTFNLTHTDSFAHKNKLITQLLNQMSDKSFTFNVTGHPCKIYGYRYLLTYYQHEPAISYLDGSFAWLYQKRLPTNPAPYSITIDNDSATIYLDYANQ